MHEANDPAELKIVILRSIILYFFKENVSLLGLLFRVGSSMVEQCPFKALVEGSSPSQPKLSLA